MILSIIVAAAENNVIGRDNGLIWHLSADLKRFKALTTGHSIVVGRKTFESIGKALPNRRNIVVSRNAAFRAEGVEMAGSIGEALEKVKEEDEVFVIGGATLYHALWARADRLYLTRVHTEAVGDVDIPAIDPGQWHILSQENFEADEKNEFAYSFINYSRI